MLYSKGSTYLLMLRLLKKHKPVGKHKRKGGDHGRVLDQAIISGVTYFDASSLSDHWHLKGFGAVDNTGDLVRYSSRRFMDLLLNKSTRPNVLTGGFATYVHRSRRKHEVRYPLLIGAFFLFLSLMVALLAS